MTLSIVFHILAAILEILLGFFVISQNPRSKTSPPLLLLIASTFVWQIGTALTLLAKDASVALLCTKVAFFGIIFIPISTYHLTLNILNIKKTKTLFVGYVIAFLCVPLCWTSLILDGVHKYAWGFFFKAGVLHPFFMVFFVYLMILAFSKLFMSYQREENNLEKNKRKYFFAAIFIAYIGAIDYLPTYGIDVLPLSFLAVAGCVVIFAYAIISYRLMDIEVIIRETAVFAGIFGFSVGIFMLAIVAGEQFIQPYIGQSQWLVPALSLLLVTFAIRPIEKLAYNVIGKHLFRKKFEYQKILRDASVGMSTVRDPKKLLGLIVHIISMKIKLTNVSILIYDEKQLLYKIKASRNSSSIVGKNMTLSTENPLIEWLTEKKKPLTLEEAQKWNKRDSSHSSKSVLTSDLVQIERRMRDLDAAVCVPSFYRDELLGILVLGDKKSGDFFSQDDLDLFSALADESAVALKNSQLYFEIDKKANELEDLYKREHRLFMHASVAFAAAIDARDPYTHGHSERVTNFSLAILDCMGAVHQIDNNPLFRQRLQIAAVLHDIGKIGVPDDILHKPSKLSDKEWGAMRKHPAKGAEIVTHIKGLRDLIGGIRHHHERYDGKGYPDGLKSDEIPFMAKIIAVADTFDAMTSDRPYRKGLPVEVAREEIQRNAAAQFDPYMVAAFLKAYEQGAIKQSAINKKVELVID